MRRFRRSFPLALGMAISFWTAVAAANPITLENAKAGTSDWRIPAANVGTLKTIDVYPSRWSVKAGDKLGLRVSTTAATFRTRIYRLGDYGGAGARLVNEVASTVGKAQPVPTPDFLYGLAECGWSDSVTLAMPSDWTPGVYLVRVTGSDGLESQTYFVLRDDAATVRAPLLYVVSSSTHQAYNSWPKGGTISTVGKSLYDWNSAGAPVDQSQEVWAVKVSFDRPYAAGYGTGDLLTWELPFIKWVESRGYFVAYATSADVDDGPVLTGRRGVMESGHDEYWSYGMFDHLKAARDGGVDLAFFTGDTASWQVRFEPSKLGDPRGVMTGYKERAYPADPATGSWPGDPYYLAGKAALAKGDVTGARYFLERVTGAWADLRKDGTIDARRPAMSLTGVLHGGSTVGDGYDWVVQNASHWIYAGTGLKDGDTLKKLVGYEWDNPRKGDSSWDDVRPKGQVILANSAGGASAPHGASYYLASSGAHVFAAGTIQWSWALDPAGGGATVHDARVETITANVIDELSLDPDPGFDAGPGSDDAGIVLTVDATGDAPDDTSTVEPEPTDDGIADAVPWMDSARPGEDAGGSDGSGAMPSGDRAGGACGCEGAGAGAPAGAGLVAFFGASVFVIRRRRSR